MGGGRPSEEGRRWDRVQPSVKKKGRERSMNPGGARLASHGDSRQTERHNASGAGPTGDQEAITSPLKRRRQARGSENHFEQSKRSLSRADCGCSNKVRVTVVTYLHVIVTKMTLALPLYIRAP